jgi:uncharacterized protein
VPWVRRLPSEYVAAHLRFTIRPLDLPPGGDAFGAVIDDLGSGDLLLFGSDYPHWHFDALADAVPCGLPPDVRQAVLVDNARGFYGL